MLIWNEKLFYIFWQIFLAETADIVQNYSEKLFWFLINRRYPTQRDGDKEE